MRIASYNIRKAVGLDWRRDGDRICRVLQEIDADIVVLQEADKRIGDRAGVLPEDILRDDLGYAFADMSVRTKSHGWHGNAILYRTNMLSLAQAARIQIPTREPRGAVSAQFDMPQFNVIGVHLALNRSVRMRQIAALGAKLSNAQGPVLVAGDFNAWRAQANIAETLGAGFSEIAPGHSFHASRPVAALDRFALRGAVQPVDYHVHQTALSARASDHLPIVIDLKFGDPAP